MYAVVLKPVSRSREISIWGKGIYPLCSHQSTKLVAVCAEKMFYLFLKQPSPQLVDNCTYGTVPFPLYREFPGRSAQLFSNCCLSCACPQEGFFSTRNDEVILMQSKWRNFIPPPPPTNNTS